MPSLSFNTIPAQTYGNAAFQVGTTSPSTGTVTFALTTGQTSAGTVSSTGLVTITGAGTIYLTASQAASGNYTAGSTTTSFTVAPEVPSLSFNTIPAQTYGNAAFQVGTTSAIERNGHLRADNREGERWICQHDRPGHDQRCRHHLLDCYAGGQRQLRRWNGNHSDYDSAGASQSELHFGSNV